MTDRHAEKTTFLNSAGWNGATVSTLAGDASNRRYDRVTLGSRMAVLMDAPADTGERTKPFAAIARALQQMDLHPPQILAEDPDRGFLLLEDLGDRVFAQLFESDPDRQIPLYTEALAILRHLQKAEASDLPAYGIAEMATALDVTAEWYAGDLSHLPVLRDPMETALKRLNWTIPVMALRDFHAENLIWCPDCDGLRRVGLLDFQDAVLCHPLYDVASLLQDARRDIPAHIVDTLKNKTWYWFADTRREFDTAFATMSAQRSLRILGVFARLSLCHGKAGYIDLMPRVWGHLQSALLHPVLADLAQAVGKTLPPPDRNLRVSLKERAGTCPAR